jgi:hypothetical protein
VSLTPPETIQRHQEALGTKAKREPTSRFDLLYNKVYRVDILAHADALAKQQGGTPSMDGETVEDHRGGGSVPSAAFVSAPASRLDPKFLSCNVSPHGVAVKGSRRRTGLGVRRPGMR